MDIKVLQKTAGMDAGGIEKFLIGISENINTEEFQVDYFLNNGMKQFYSKRIEAAGGNIYYPRGSEQKNSGKICRMIEFYKFLKRSNYDVIHINESLLVTAADCFIAKLAGCKCIIAHSHNDHSPEYFTLIQKLIHKLERKIIMVCANKYFACSGVAAKWLFGDTVYQKKMYVMIPNGIVASEYVFNEEIRHIERRKLGIEESFVIGHVGRFFEQKNHNFLLEIFSEVVKLHPNSKLLLIGDGPLLNNVKEQCRRLKLDDKVIFYGLSKEVARLMQAMDCFVFPSIYEGLGIVAIEAQASGLPCVLSDKVPIDAKITELVKYVPLEIGSNVWTQEIIKIKNIIRKDTSEDVRKAGFDIKEVAVKLEKIYTSLVKFN